MSRPGTGGGGRLSGSVETNRHNQHNQHGGKYLLLSSTVNQFDPVAVNEDSFVENGDVQLHSTTMFPDHGQSGLLTTKSSNASAAPPMSMAVLMLIVVASLSMVVGAIYLLIYFKSIKPMSARSRSYADPGGGKGDDDGGARKSAGHPFFRRK